MDILWFLRQRLEFTKYLYDTSAAPFCETMRKIKDGEPPYIDNRNPDYDDVGEPPYLSEYLTASEATEVVGHWCLMMVYASLKAFLKKYVAEMATTYRDAFSDAETKLAATRAGNWLERYRIFFLEELKIDWHKGPVEVEHLEQINLARNDIVHNVDVRTTYVYQSKQHAERFPHGLFVDEAFASLGLDGRIKAGGDQLAAAIQSVDSFCAWLERIRGDYLGHLKSAKHLPDSPQFGLPNAASANRNSK